MKNMYTSLALTFCLCISFGLQAQTDPDLTKVDNDGDGLIEIWTLAQLDHMRHNLAGTSYMASSGGTAVTTGCPTSGGCTGYELMANLDFTDKTATGYQADWDPVVQTAKQAPGAGWVPVGTSDGNFTGTFDGNGHTIANLYVNVSSDGPAYAGLFGYAGGATLRNLGLTGSHMYVKASSSASPPSYSSSYAGGLVGYAGNATLTNCYATGNVSSSGSASYNSSSHAGGLVGLANGTITNCYAVGDVTAVSSSSESAGSDSQAGGLVGSGGTITNCYATGDVTSSSSSSGPHSSSAGGLVGSGGTIANCYATGDVSSSSLSPSDSFSGGLVGVTSGTVTNCYATGDVTSTVAEDSLNRAYTNSYAGGVISQGSTPTACYYSGTVREGTRESLTDVAQVEGQYKTETQLKALTAATSGWSTSVWDFGTNQQLPRLRPAANNDGDDGGNDDDGDDDGDDDDDTALREKIAALETWKSEMQTKVTALETKVTALESQNINAITFTKRDLNEPDIVSGTTKKSIVIVPNPVQQTLGLTVYQDYDYAIYDSAGGSVKTGKTSEGSIDVSELRAGTYVLQLKSVTETYALQFIKE